MKTDTNKIEFLQAKADCIRLEQAEIFEAFPAEKREAFHTIAGNVE